MYVALYPTFSAQAQQLTEIYSTLPESFFAAFGASDLAFATLEGFMAAENFGFVWPLLVILIITGLAGSAFAGEIEKDTIELVLARPISRTQYYLGKYAAALLTHTVFTLVSVFSIVMFAKIYDIDYVFGSYMAIALAGIFFGWAITGISFFLSCIFSDKSKVLFLTGGILFAMYITNIVARLNQNLEGLKYFSLFNYFGGEILTDGTVAAAALVVLGLTALVTTVLGMWYWNKRDIQV
jgi:ABC-2 type transport system permease protein